MWHRWAPLDQLPLGFDHCEVALQARNCAGSHTYRDEGTGQYLTIVEEEGRRYFKDYPADELDGPRSPLADTAERPFAVGDDPALAPGRHSPAGFRGRARGHS